eukprot:m51a1_g12529 putative serine threonine protein kinase (297) ;mRNA; r:3-3832
MIEIERQIKEIAILSEIRHPNVLLFVRSLPTLLVSGSEYVAGQMGACIEPHNMFIVTEWMDMGNLRQVIRSGPQMDVRQGVAILSSICSALKYLHISNIVHRDLKSSNILLSKKMDVKLSDFGLAAVKTANKTSTLCGTIAWMAPEVLSGAVYSEASDVYSFGVVMNEIVTCEVPFKGLNKVAIVREILQGRRPVVTERLGTYTIDYVGIVVPSSWMVLHGLEPVDIRRAVLRSEVVLHGPKPVSSKPVRRCSKCSARSHGRVLEMGGKMFESLSLASATREFVFESIRSLPACVL